MSDQNNANYKSRYWIDKLCTAIRRGEVSGLRDILQKSVNVGRLCAHDGKSVLYHSIVSKQPDIVQLLLKHDADTNISSHVSYQRDHSGVQNSFEEPAIVTAARLGQTEITKHLLEAGADANGQSLYKHTLGPGTIRDRTSLHFAVEDCNLELVLLLLRFNAEVNICDRQRELPLHIAVRCKQFVCSPQSEIVQALCRHGSPVNDVNKIECSPLYLSTFYACWRKCSILLEFGADINQNCMRDSSYGTALHIAAIKDRTALTELLIASGANLNIKNPLQCTPLQLNINSHSKSEIAAMLVYHGADTNGIDRYQFTVLAAIIRNMRLDCEVLGRLLVFAGYDLRQDLWLRPGKPQEIKVMLNSNMYSIHQIPYIAVPEGRVHALCEWLRDMQRNALSLKDICRISLRRFINCNEGGASIEPCVLALPLPTVIHEYLLLKDVYTYVKPQ